MSQGPQGPQGVGPPPPKPDGTEGTATVTLTLKDEHDESKTIVYKRNGLIISSRDNEDFKNFLNTDTQKIQFFIYFCSIDLPESWKDRLVKYEIKVHRFTKNDDKFYTIDENADEGILVKGYHIFLPLVVNKFNLNFTSKFPKFLKDYSKKFKRDQQQIDCKKIYNGLIKCENSLVKFVKITFSRDNNRLELRDELFKKLVDGPLLLCSNGKDHAVGWCAKARDNIDKITWYKYESEGATDIIWKKSSALETVNDSSGNSDAPSNQDTVDAINSHCQTSPGQFQGASQPTVGKADLYIKIKVKRSANNETEVEWEQCYDYLLSQNPPPFQEMLSDTFNLIHQFTSRSSINVLVKVPSVEALDKLWESYKLGDLQKKLEKVIVTDDLMKLAPKDTIRVELSVFISTDEYHKVRHQLYLMNEKKQDIQGSDITEIWKASCDQPDSVQPAPEGASSSSQPTPQGGSSTSQPTPQGASIAGQPIQEPFTLMKDLIQTNSKVKDCLKNGLDYEYRLLSNWRHLADQLKDPPVPQEVKEACESGTIHSPTWEVLGLPDICIKPVQDLMNILSTGPYARIDVNRELSKEIPEAERSKCIQDVLLNKLELMDRIAGKLDVPADIIKKNWFYLGQRLGIHNDDLELIKRGNNPAEKLLLYVYRTLPQEKKSAAEFRRIIMSFEDRVDLHNFVTDILKIKENDDPRPLIDIIQPDSNEMKKVTSLLNKSTGGIKNWRTLAREWKLDFSVYDTFDPLPRPSPTGRLLEWMCTINSQVSVEVFLNILGEKMKRHDIKDELEKIIQNCN